ncbi:MAG: type II secretion system F family protein [Terriglobia bacterium]
MGDIQELRARLAGEEAALAETRKQIAAAQHTIEELRSRSEALEKRVKLLREYIQMVEAGGEGAHLPEALPQELGLPEAQPPELALPEAQPPELALPEAQPAHAAPAGTGLPSWLTLSRLASEPQLAEAPSFEAGIDEQRLANDILPRAASFEDALLLLLAHRRKRLTPKDIIKAFRRLEYAPAARAMPDWVEAQLEQRPTFFAHAGRNGFVLTKEGQREAQRILNQLRF